MRLGLIPAMFCVCSSAIADVSRGSLRAAAEYSASRKGTRLLVIQHGKTLLDERQNGGPVTMKIYSGTKGFWNLAALAAQEDGLLDLDERASATLPEWAGDGRRSAITLRELLNFTSGLDAMLSLHGDGFADRNALALRAPVVGATERSFIYGPASLQVFHEVLKRKLAARRETPTQYLERRVLHPLGLGGQRYMADRDGNPLVATGFTMSAEHWARMGRLVLNHGAPVLHGGLDGVGRGSAANPMFAQGFWGNRLAASPGAREVDPEDLLELKWHRQEWSRTCLCRAAPVDLVASIGSGGQRLYVIPSLDLIVVRLGFMARFSDGAFLRALLAR